MPVLISILSFTAGFAKEALINSKMLIGEEIFLAARQKVHEYLMYRLEAPSQAAF